MKADYINHYSQLNNTKDYIRSYTYAKEYYDAELQQIFKYANKTEPALDIGSGYGYLAQYLYDNGFKSVDCVDTSKGLLDVISTWVKPAPKLHHQDGLKFLKTTKTKYGVITMFDLFEHFPAEQATDLARAAFDSLTDDGILIIRTPNMANVLGIYSKYIDITHYQCYTQFSLSQVLLDAGFDPQLIQIWEPQWKIGSAQYSAKQENDEFHRKLFQLQDRATPKTFDKNLLMSAHKAKQDIHNPINDPKPSQKKSRKGLFGLFRK